MHLISNDLTPIHWAVAGVGITATTLSLLCVANRRLGISTGFEDVCSLVLQQPYFRRGSVRSRRKWRLPFLFERFQSGAQRILNGDQHGRCEPA